MNSIKQQKQKFLDDYPNLFREFPRSGFDVGEGWYPLLHELCHTLEPHIESLPEEIRSQLYVVQIKEKFGGLRFYMQSETPYMRGAIAVAERMSYLLCEHCGNKGTRRSGGWIRTECDDCYREEQMRRENIARKFREIK
jgi:hypothetical protein